MAGSGGLRALRQLGVYAALTFAITWGLAAVLLLARPQLEAVIGPLGPINHHWIYFLAVSAPSISAVLLSLLFGGWSGLKELAARFVRRAPWGWIAAAVLTWPAILALSDLAARLLGAKAQIDLHALAVGAPALALTTRVLIVDPGGLAEETGWRGYALPRLLKLMSPGAAALLLGLVWGVWHLPAFFVSDLAQSQFAFGWFLVGITGVSVFMTWIYVHARGNVLVAGVIPHLVFNLMADAHVLPHDGARFEGVAGGLLGLALLAGFGPSLQGWRRREAPQGATAGPSD